MRVEEGTVREKKGSSILVETACESFCSSCSTRESCAVAGEPGQKREFWIENTLSALPGSRVSFGIKESEVVVSSLILYLLPIIGLIGGIGAGGALYPENADMSSIAGGLAGMALAFIIIFIAGKILKGRSVITPVLLELFSDSPEK